MRGWEDIGPLKDVDHIHHGIYLMYNPCDHVAYNFNAMPEIGDAD